MLNILILFWSIKYIQNSVIKVFIEKCYDKINEKYRIYRTERKWIISKIRPIKSIIDINWNTDMNFKIIKWHYKLKEKMLLKVYLCILISSLYGR